MIQINEINIYLDEFSKKLSTCLYKELKKSIENKKVTKPQGAMVVDGLTNADIECLQYIKKNIKAIVNADVQQLKEFLEEMDREYPALTKSYAINDIKPKLYKAVKYIFIDRGYESKISSANDGKIAYRLVKEIGLGSCPYCNRNYISSVTKDKKDDSKTRPQLDHFYPKAVYPFLACSFYNLIPSCATCNLMKSDKDSYSDKLISPYEMKKDTFKFSYDLNSVDILNIEFSEKYDHKHEKSINIIFDKKNETNEKYFELEKLYNQEHRNVVIELLVKKAYYPQSYINELSNFGFSQDEVYRYLFSNYNQDDDLHKRPLSKLVQDISEELGLLK